MAGVVLTADRTLMSEYQNNMFFGFSASFPKKFVPGPVYYAMQIGSLIILPMLILVIGGVSGMFVMGPMLLLVLSLGIFLLDYILIQIGADSLAGGP
jgi:hypothetical protein